MKQQLDYIEKQTNSNPEYCVLWLHGLGADGHDFSDIIPSLNLNPDLGIQFIFPHAPIQPVSLNGGMAMRSWFDFNTLGPYTSVDINELDMIKQALLALIEKKGYSAKNTIIAGFSQGGALALYTGLSHHTPFLGVIGLSTFVPAQQHLAKHLNPDTKKTHLLMAHGKLDPVVPYQLGEASFQALTALGYTIDFQAYMMMHQVVPDELTYIGQWINQRFTESGI